MDTELARTFLTVVASGNFITASERLHVSQSTVSTRIQALEEQLGCTLFVRNKAGATLVRIWRAGTSASGPIWTFEAVGGKEDFYFLMKQQGTGKVDPGVRAALESLIDQVSLELAG